MEQGKTNIGTRKARLALGLALLGIFPFAWLIRPWAADQPAFSTCALKMLTGEPCLFCGMTRAFTRLVHGEFAQAYHFNPLYWLAAAIIASVGMIAITDAIRGTDTTGWLGKQALKWLWLIAATIVAGTAVRMMC